jgi:hypothetical protein
MICALDDAVRIAERIESHRFVYRDESDLQSGIADVLAGEGVSVEREVRLSETDRIDLLVGRVGVEVKTRGSLIAVVRQLLRYTHSDRLDAVVLATTVAQLGWVPSVLGGKPIVVASLLGGAW